MRLARDGGRGDGRDRGQGQRGTGPGPTAVRRLEPDWLLIGDRNFYNWADWCAAADCGAQLLWRVEADLRLPVLALLPDGSYRSVLIDPKIRDKARARLIEAARAGADLEQAQARYIRVIEYQVPDGDGDGKGELIALITTITDPAAAPAPALAEAYHQRWEHETGNNQLKTQLRGPGRVLRSKSPDMVRQEIYGYLLTHHAISALICRAATEADIDPDRIKFKRTVRIIRRRVTDPAFPPEQRDRILARVMTSLTSRRNLNPRRRHRTYPRVVKRADTTPTGSRRRPTWEPGTTAPPPSSWRTSKRSASRYDQLKLSGIALRGGSTSLQMPLAGRVRVVTSGCRLRAFQRRYQRVGVRRNCRVPVHAAHRLTRMDCRLARATLQCAA